MQTTKIIETIPKEMLQSFLVGLIGIIITLIGVLIGLVKRYYNRDLKVAETNIVKMEKEVEKIWEKIEKERNWRIADDSTLRNQLSAVDKKANNCCLRIDGVEKLCQERHKK